MPENLSVRLDKWLWAARFYKTRRLATGAIKGGKIYVNGQRCKPSKAVEIGQIIRISKNYQQIEVKVLALSDKRGSFSIAQTLYQELPESIEKREKEALMRKLAKQHTSHTDKGRPTKRNRRQIIRFTQK
ncbi:MAG: hypothetical protein CR975_05675 [Gammaproteobacteria bacterium]|nr:MAG: hypothetical protein CR975_05675 [Gammaproteobacteria bacterium]